MKRILALMAIMMLVSSVCMAGEYTGYLSDKKCANAKAAHAGCAKNCVNGGQPIVLVEEGEGGKVNDIHNQDAVKDKVGEKVTVTGKLSGSSLHVDSVK